MKKIILSIICLFSLFLFVGCSKKIEKISINVVPGISDTVELTAEKLYTKIENKESFVLLLYYPTCNACEEFDPILNKFITENSYEIYSADIKTVLNKNAASDKTEKILYDFFKVKYTPSIVVIKDGELYNMINANDNQDIFWENGLTDHFNKYVTRHLYLTITDEILDKKIANKDTFVIWFKDNDTESKAFEEKFFNNYAQIYGFKDNILFQIDVTSYINDEEDEDAWKNFKAKYGLSYGDGVMPILQYFKDGVLTDTISFYNDVLSYDINTMKATITNSIYPDFIGKDFVISAYNVDKKTGKVYARSDEYNTKKVELHVEKAKTFFDKYIKK